MGATDGMPRLRFEGAARTVTGSRHVLEAGGLAFMIDCGLCQERSLRARNWEPFVPAPGRLAAVLLTHAHLDHCGLLPRLAREGFRGPVYATGPTAEIARIVMRDSARLQAEDVEAKRARHGRENRTGPFPLEPLYTEKDAEAAASLFRPVRFGETIALGGGVSAEFFEAGHILGSASIRVRAGAGAAARTVLFSGDIGRWGRPIINDPSPCDAADYVLMESTYGDRLHGDEETIAATMKEAVDRTLGAGGNVVIPSFAIERSQEVLWYLNALRRGDARDPVVFLDSPMATKVTDVYVHWPEYFDREMRALLAEGRSPFELPGLVMARSSEESKAINRVTGGAVIIAGSGMCTGGRIKHHLARNISRPECTILFVGYQADGTLGREILDGAREVRILGQACRVRARVEKIGGFSAHADRAELLRWAGALRTAPRRAFVVHGEPEAAEAFAGTLRAEKGWSAHVPAPGEAVTLS